MGVALVTGAGRGLGATIARRLAARGWTVAVNDLPGRVSSVLSAITEDGGTALAAPADVTSEDEVRALVDLVGPVEVLVANATGPQPVVGLEDLTWRAHLDQLEFFVKSPTLLARAALPGMKALGRGRIVHIGSDMPDRALPGWSAYAAAKSALLALTRVWARELGPFGITVNLVAPGWIPVERHVDATVDEHAAYVADVPLGRMGTPDDIASAVAYLASAEAGFVTGQCLTVNGGHTVPH
ncbi:MAG: SDR family oxidoreductase [Actinophytocola sp.]|uniref:SDR family oxidoreductase n=1 Tax=Actinophytocola sp. TaxID=1872138 RepID=UPI001328ABD3|nr:SDR family oxidoreductase [Actinophytocola sp.]MPZ85412.1 SDR family oxidoreductase [Actinophytocola sp.]